MPEQTCAIPKNHEVIVAPLAAGREALAILLMITVIVLLAGLRFYLIDPVEKKDSLQSWQISNLRLKNQAPVMYRTLLGVVGDIVYLREVNKQWPAPHLLEEEGLPPFADTYLPSGLRSYRWQMHQFKGWVDYYGVNTSKSVAGNAFNAGTVAAEQKGDPLENSFILRIIDQEKIDLENVPVQQMEQNPEQLFTPQVWINPQKAKYPGQSPVEQGWKRIISSGTGSR